MSESVESETIGVHAAHDQDVSAIAFNATVLVAVNILLMLAVTETPYADLGIVVFSNFFVGIAVFAATVGGGYWLASRGTASGNLTLAGFGVLLAQAGYALFGSAALTLAPPEIRQPAVMIATVVTGAITAVVVLVVYNTSRSFAKWQTYSFVSFIVGLVVGASSFFVDAGSYVAIEAPVDPLLAAASVFFFLGFLLDLFYEIWAVKVNRYASDLRNAIGIYVAVMGVFVHILMWVLRILSMLDQ